MGYRKWRETNMVTPSWGSFQKNDQNPNRNEMEENEEEELKEEVPGDIEDQEKPEGEKPDWGNFKSPNTYQGEPDPTEDESTFGYIARNAVRGASRIAEQVAGRFGNVEKFTKDMLANAPKSGGIIGWAVSELIGQENWEKLIRGEGKQLLPTSQQFKSASETISGGYTSPKTKGEKESDEFIEDVGSTLNRRGGTPLQMTANHLLIPAAANVTKKVVNDLGFGEDKANLAKMAVWFPLSLATNVNGPQHASNLMNQGRNGFNPNNRANVPFYEQELNRVSNRMLQGDPRSLLAQQQIAGVRSDIANGQTTMRDLMTRYDALNATKRDRGLFALNAGDRRAAIRNINEVRDVIRDQIETIGMNTNPQALEQWQNGVQAWATIHRSNALTNWVKETAKGPYAKILTGPAAALFGVGSLGAAKAPLLSAPASLAASGAYKTGQTLYRMWNDPRLANYYWNAVNAAMEENVPAFINNYQRLNKGLEKSVPSKPESKSKK